VAILFGVERAAGRNTTKRSEARRLLFQDCRGSKGGAGKFGGKDVEFGLQKNNEGVPHFPEGHPQLQPYPATLLRVATNPNSTNCPVLRPRADVGLRVLKVYNVACLNVQYGIRQANAALRRLTCLLALSPWS
jgi:hypothetical protein